MGTLLAALCGILIAGGLVLLAAGLRPSPPKSTTLSTGLWKKVVD